MKPRDVFEIIVRVIGLVVGFYGLTMVLFAIFRSAGAVIVARQTITVDAVFGALYLLVGAALLFGGRWVTRLVYGRDQISN